MIGRVAIVTLLLAGCAGTQDAGVKRAASKASLEATGRLGGLQLACAAGDEQVTLGGGDVQVVELWATWCQPCIKALPLWAELARTEAVDILAVSIDDEREAPLRFADKHGIDLPILWDPFGQRVADAVPLGGVVPTTLVVDCTGTVRHVHEGFGSAQVVDDVAAQVRALRQEAACVQPARPVRCTP